MFRGIFAIILGGLIGLMAACGQPAQQTISNKPQKVYTPVSHIEAQSSNQILGIPGDPTVVFDPGMIASADAVLGGLMYDTWWLGSTQFPMPPEPPVDLRHPLFPADSGTLGPETFRCSTCHGWDYLGAAGVYGDPAAPFYTGIKGIISPADPYVYNTDQEIWTFLHDGDATNGLAEHHFGDVLSDEDLYHLTKFILQVREEAGMQQSPADLINADKSAKGDSLRGYRFFHAAQRDGGAGCANYECHGSDGKQLLLDQPIDSLARDNPWEVLHKIRFGNPGTYMKGIVILNSPNLDLQAAADILRYAQIGLAPDHVRGGRLYDNWPVETGITGIAASNPLWDLADPSLMPAGFPTGDDAWRCALCHAFYYEGNIAFYFNNLLYLKTSRNWTTAYVFEQLQKGFPAVMPDGSVSTVHDFGAHLQETELWQLAAFAVQDIEDTSIYLQPDLGTAVGNGTRTANPVLGQALYEGTAGVSYNGAPFDCIGCHDPVNGSVPSVDVAALAWDTPWQFLHRVRFGMPHAPDAPADTIMPGLLEVTTADSENYLQTIHVVDIQRYLQDLAMTP